MFPNRIAFLRQSRRPVVSQQELSLTIGISERQLRRIERGEIAPHAKLLWRIAEALLVAVTDLFARRRDGKA